MSTRRARVLKWLKNCRLAVRAFSDRLTRRKALRILFSFAILFYAFVAYESQLIENALLPGSQTKDAISYEDAAEMFYSHGKAHHTRPMGIAAIVGMPYVIGVAREYHIYWNYGLNLICWLLTLYLIFATIVSISSNFNALIAAFLFACCIGPIAISFHVLTESVFTLLLTTMGYWLVRHKLTGAGKYLIYAFALFLFGVLIRTGGYYLSIPFAAIIVWQFVRMKLKPGWSLLWVGLGLLAIIGQNLTMQEQHGNFTPSYIDKVTWYYFLGARSQATVDQREYLEERTYRYSVGGKMDLPTFSEHSGADMKRLVTQHPGAVIENLSTALMFNATQWSTFITMNENLRGSSFFDGFIKQFKSISKQQNITFSLVTLGLVVYFLFALLFRRRQLDVVITLLVMIISYTMLTSAISFWQGDRFHVVLYPLCIIAAFYVVFHLRKQQSSGSAGEHPVNPAK